MISNLAETAIANYIAQSRQPACAYFYDLAALRRHVAALTATLPARCRLMYAVKANSHPEILQTLAPLVDGFDVASLGEVQKVRAVCATGRMALGGPGKTEPELRAAMALDTAHFHMESAHQLQVLNQVAVSLDRQVEVLLRVNPDIAMPAATLQMGGKSTQFGIDQRQISGVIELCRQLPGVRLAGFHFHAISNHLDPLNHVNLIEQYFERVRRWQRAHDLDIRCINVGGGIGVNYAQPQRRFDWPLFCARLGALVADYGDLITPGVEVVFECGRFISAECGYYLAQVLDIKQNHGQHFAVLRGGSHHFRLPVSWQHNHPFQVIAGKPWQQDYPQPRITQCDVTLCGELCTPKDVLARRVPVASLKVGDCVLFTMAGAYGWHISHHDFLNHPHPDFVYLDA